ncbi:MAG: hypothetical protein ACUZ8E_15680 [Candidatus Anammoxibacter sp.]
MRKLQLYELIPENVETAISYISDNEITQCIPIIKDVINTFKAVNSFRDKFLVNKVYKFIECLTCIPKDEKTAFKRKLCNSFKEREKVASAIIVTLDNFSDIMKAEMLSLMFIAYIDNVINQVDFRRLCDAINFALYEDLEELLSDGNNNSTKTTNGLGNYMKYLSNSGLTEPKGGNSLGDVGEIFYRISELGKVFLKAYGYGTFICAKKITYDEKMK